LRLRLDVNWDEVRVGLKVLGVVLLVCAAGCRVRLRPDAAEGFGTRPVSLRGTYGVERGAELEPVLKVDETKTGYAFEERTTGEWGADPETPHVVSEDEVRRAVGSVSVPVFGLATTRATLLKLPVGWKNEAGFMTKSGFVLVSAGRLVEARKVELGGR
jgi:hypothetical protein